MCLYVEIRTCENYAKNYRLITIHYIAKQVYLYLTLTIRLYAWRIYSRINRNVWNKRWSICICILIGHFFGFVCICFMRMWYLMNKQPRLFTEFLRWHNLSVCLCARAKIKMCSVYIWQDSGHCYHMICDNTIKL